MDRWWLQRALSHDVVLARVAEVEPLATHRLEAVAVCGVQAREKVRAASRDRPAD